MCVFLGTVSLVCMLLALLCSVVGAALLGGAVLLVMLLVLLCGAAVLSVRVGCGCLSVGVSAAGTAGLGDCESDWLHVSVC